MKENNRKLYFLKVSGCCDFYSFVLDGKRETQEYFSLNAQSIFDDF